MIRRDSPWKTLARVAGPMMVWLSVSFLLLILLLSDDWVRNSLGEVEPVTDLSLLLRSAVSAGIGVVLIVWGYSGKPTAYMQAVVPLGKSVCPNCGAELLSTTSVCPYCGREVGLR